MRIFLLAWGSILPQWLWAQPADSTVSTDQIFIGTFANDATFRTDYYFTQGITANLIHPFWKKSPVTKILLRPKIYTTHYYGLKIWYDGFTPLSITDSEIRYGDRPYASYLYASNYVVANRATHKTRLISGLDIGFIGPGAGAEAFQVNVHKWLDSPIPQGWDYQIQTDLILGYQVAVEKQILAAGRAVEFIGQAGASLGTLYTNATGGFLLRTGKMNPYFRNLGIASRANRANLQRFQFYGQGRIEGRLVGYNATLQGGLLNQNNPYTLPTKLMKRSIAQKSAGLVAAYKGFSFESSVVWLSREIKTGRKHQWIHFDLRFAF